MLHFPLGVPFAAAFYAVRQFLRTFEAQLLDTAIDPRSEISTKHLSVP